MRHGEGGRVRDMLSTWIGIGALLLSIVAVHVNTQVEVARLDERFSSFQNTNVKTLRVLQKLANSVDRLSVSVARLDERTKSLERSE